MEKVLDGLHTAILIWLLFDDNCIGSENPWFFIQMADETRKHPIGVHGWNSRNVPLMNSLRGRVN
jgi:hypothetical protein